MKRLAFLGPLILCGFCGCASAKPSAVTRSPAQSSSPLPPSSQVWIPDPNVVGKYSKTCDPRNFGAKGDGKNDDTSAIKAAIQDCAGGGVVSLSGGTFMSGTVTLTTGITLNIDTTATLKGIPTPNAQTTDALYPDITNQTTAALRGDLNTQLSNCRKALVSVIGAHGVTIQGGGTIDGSGGDPYWTGIEYTRPMAVFVAKSDHVWIHDITVQNSAMWSLVDFESVFVTIQHVNVNSPNGPTRDGIDVVDGHHILVENSNVFSEDDSLCLKSGSSIGLYDVIVRQDTITNSTVANGLKLGTASVGACRDILFEDIKMKNVKQAAMALESVDGSVIQGVAFHNIEFANTGAAVYMVLGVRKGTNGVYPKVGTIKDVTFDGIRGVTNLPWGSAISGSVVNGKVAPIRNVTFNNVNITNAAFASTIPNVPPEYTGQYPDPRLWQGLPAYGFFMRHVVGVHETASMTTPAKGDVRKQNVFDDVTDLNGN